MADERTFDDETMALVIDELGKVARDALLPSRLVTCIPDPSSNPDLFDQSVEGFGRLLAEAVSKRPRPLVLDSLVILIDVRMADSVAKMVPEAVERRDGVEVLWCSENPDPSRRGIVFLPLIVPSDAVDRGLLVLRRKYDHVGELLATVSVVFGTDCAACRRIVAVTRTSKRGAARWWSSGVLAADRTAKLGKWIDKDPPVPDVSKIPVRATSAGSSMIN